MKKNLLFFWLIFTTTIYSQTNIVFCPPGAEWKYLYFKPNSSSQPYIYPKIRWISDTTINGEQLKTLYADVFFTYDNVLCSHWIYTKQIGDTIFMKSCYTQNQWEILYNYAALPGQQWLTTIKDAYYPSSVPVTHTITVDSVRTTLINGFNLKQLFVTTCYIVNGTQTCFHNTIMERIGSSGFLFSYYKKIYSIEYDIWQDFLCYKDNSFSPTAFSTNNRDCDYTYNVGIKTNELAELIRTFPNPCSEDLNVEFPANGRYLVCIRALDGKMMGSYDVVVEKLNISLKNIDKGIYFLEVFRDNRLVTAKKIIII